MKMNTLISKRTGYICFTLCVFCLVLFNQFSCSKNKDSYLAFGSTDESPLRSGSNTSNAYEIQESFRKIYNLYRERVVFITTEQVVRVRRNPFYNDPFFRKFFGPGPRERVQRRAGLGSGFIISKDGYICTNHHVIKGVDKVTVHVNEKTYNAKIIGSDENTDIALLKIDARIKLKSVFFGDSDAVNVGDWAIAIGSPFGLDKTFTVGVVSAIGRRDLDMMGGSHIQTDASINPGNSGGPLINIYGEVIGINRMIYSKSGGYMGIGFAIPVNTARSVLNQLKKYKRIKRGYVGISILPLNEEYSKELGLPSQDGVFIGDVVKGGPSDKAGMKVGDVILEANGEKIRNYKDLLGNISRAPIGKKIKMTIWRNRKKINIYVLVAERPE